VFGLIHLRRGILLLTLLAAPVHAGTPDEVTRKAARELGNAGVTAYQAGDHAAAVDKLEKAYAVVRVPSIGLWLARALARTGRLVEARDRYEEVTKLEVAAGDRAIQAQAQAEAMTEVETLRARIPSIIVRLEGASASEVDVTIDGKPIGRSSVGAPFPADPGLHVIEGRRGSETERFEVTLPEGRSETVMLRFAAPPPGLSPAPGPTTTPASPPARAPERARSAPLRTLGWVGVGAGAAGLVTGSVFGALAASKRDAILKNPACEGDRCPPSESDSVQTLHTYRTVSTVAFVAGGVFAGVGLTLLLASSSESGATVEARVHAGGATVEGSF